MRAFLFIILSLIIVAFGQPSWAPSLAPLAAVVGYAMFWKAMLLLPSRKKQFWVAVLWYLLVQAIQLSWLSSLTAEYRDLFIIAGYFGLVVWLGLQFGLLSLFIPSSAAAFTLKRALAIASIWTLLEWARLHYFLCGFSWNPAGMALAFSPITMQLAAVWGVLGLSFWVMFSNLLALRVFEQRRQKILWMQLSAVALFPYLFGIAHIAYNDRIPQTSKTVSVGLVQTGLLVSEKMPVAGHLSSFVSPLEQWRRIFHLIKTHEQDRFDLVVLPEAVVPFGLEPTVFGYEDALEILSRELGSDVAAYVPPLIRPFARKKWIEGKLHWRVSNAFFAQSLANYLKAEVIAGLDAEDHVKKIHYNAAFQFLPQKTQLERYEKRILLPFAEYLPFQQCGLISNQFGLSQFFTQGHEAKVFHHTIPLSLSICYEETFSYLMREGRRKGAAVFVNLTNDNWYPSSRLTQQHFYHGRLRAVENGIPLLRACNTGITAAVDPFGRSIATLGLGEGAGILSTKVNLTEHQTLYTFWGDAGILGLSILFLGLNISLIRKKPCSK